MPISRRRVRHPSPPKKGTPVLWVVSEAPPARSKDSVTVPADVEQVIGALRDKAKTGNPQAAREYREWLVRFGLVAAPDADLDIVSLEDMTPDQRAFALAWAERQIARAAR